MHHTREQPVGGIPVNVGQCKFEQYSHEGTPKPMTESLNSPCAGLNMPGIATLEVHATAPALDGCLQDTSTQSISHAASPRCEACASPGNQTLRDHGGHVRTCLYQSPHVRRLKRSVGLVGPSQMYQVLCPRPPMPEQITRNES